MLDSSTVVVRNVLDPESLTAAIRNADFQPYQLSVKPSPSRLVRVMCPRACLDFAELGPAMLFSGSMPKDCYTLVFVTACPEKGRSFNFTVEHNDGYMGFFPPGGLLDAFTPEGYANATLTVPALVFEEAVERLFPEIPALILKQGAGLRIGTLEQTRMRTLLSAIAARISDAAHSLCDKSVRSRMECELLDTFIAALRDGCGSTIPIHGLRVQGKMKRLRQARDYLTAHRHEPVSLADLCAELGMSRRGVEMLFQANLGIGPNAFIRQTRLHGVRDSLLQNATKCSSVKQAALTWGFWHLGHFAKEYHQLFGERPSATLQRRS